MSNCSACAAIVVRVAGAAIRMPRVPRGIQLDPGRRRQTADSRSLPSRAANDEFVRGKADPIANLSNQLAARAIAEASGEEDEA